MSSSRFNLFANWEYWPSFMFYVPNVPYAAYLALRSGSLVFYTAANPIVPFSGNGAESKFKTLQLLPEAVRPKSIFIQRDSNPTASVNEILKNGLSFPVILKPDIGFRGLLVKKIKDKPELLNYLTQYNSIDLIAQEFIELPHEMGIFYHRIPIEKQGHISSVTLKQYPFVTGNGIATLRELILQDPRLRKYEQLLIKLHSKDANRVLPSGKILPLSEIGNHSKGTRFINGNYLINSSLTSSISDVFDQIPDWYYGRIDLKYNSIDTLKKGVDFKVIELNGIISEPTHIYDAECMNYFMALREIRKHWKYLFQIAKVNHQKRNVPFASVTAFLKSLKKIRNHTRTIKQLHSQINLD